MLLTPEELVKEEVRNLQSPDQFVVPKFTLPISPDVLQKDAQLSPLSLTYSRGGGASNNDLFSQSLPWGRGRGIESLASHTKPFFPLMGKSGEPSSERQHENVEVKKLIHGATKQPLLTPDVFTKPNHLADGQGEHELKKIPGDFTSSKSRNVQQMQEIIPESLSNFNNSNLYPVKSKIQRDPPNLVNPKPTQGGKKKKKKQLINLSTGKILGTENSVGPVTKSLTEPKQATSPTFSYAAALSASKQDSEENAKTNGGLSMKSIAMDLLREPSEPESSLPESRSKPSNVSLEDDILPEAPPRDLTLPTTSTPWGSATPSHVYAVDNEEFPSLKEAEELSHQKVKPSVAFDKLDIDVVATSNKQGSSDFAFSEEEDSDEETWFLGEASLAKAAPQAANKELGNSWKPGQRKCLICGDVNHLVYDCPNKNKNFILS